MRFSDSGARLYLQRGGHEIAREERRRKSRGKAERTPLNTYMSDVDKPVQRLNNHMAALGARRRDRGAAVGGEDGACAWECSSWPWRSRKEAGKG